MAPSAAVKRVLLLAPVTGGSHRIWIVCSAMSEVSTRVEDRGPGRSAREDTVSVTDLVVFLQRSWILIGAFILAGALVAWLSAAVMARNVYRATATLVIVPPPIASELKPPTLTVQGYQKLLESDAVVAEAKGRLADSGVIPAGYRLAVGMNLGTEIFVSRRAEERELAPMLRAIASAEDPELAAAIANEWAGVFLERTQELVAGTTSPAVSYIEEQYPRARDRVAELETQRVATANSFQKKYDDAASSWDDRITTYKADLAHAIADYSAESQRLIGALDAELGLDGRTARVDALHATAGSLQREQATVETRLQQGGDELAAALELLESTPQKLRVSKAMTDDAVWQAVAGSRDAEIDWDKLLQRQLVSEEPNPVYFEVSRRVASLKLEVAGLEPRAKDLANRLDALESDLRQRQSTMARDRASLTALGNDRDAGLTAIQERGDLTVAVMTRDRDRALAEIARERDAALARLDRDVDQSRALFEELTVHFNQAVIAKAQSEVEDVRLGAEAVPPTASEPHHSAMKALLGALLGGLVGLVVAIFREARPERQAVGS